MKEVEQALQQLARKARGRLTPRAVVNAARDEKHPLHEYFEWNDSKAGERFRLQQARQLIRSVKLSVTVNRHELKGVFYIRNPDNDPPDQGYIAVVSLRDDKEKARAAMQKEFERIAANMERARAIAAVLGLSDELEALIIQLIEFQERLAA